MLENRPANAASLVDDLTQAEATRARSSGTLESWSLDQIGMQHYDRQTPAEYAEAHALFKRAVELDPQFPTAKEGRLSLLSSTSLLSCVPNFPFRSIACRSTSIFRTNTQDYQPSPRYAHEVNLPGLRFWPLTLWPHLVIYVEPPEHIHVWRVLLG